MKPFLVITGLIFLVIGLRALVKPTSAVADLFSLRIEGTDALNYLRASAGGVTIFCGLVMIAVMYCDWLVSPALVLVTAVLGGLLFGRVISLFVDGRPSVIVWISAAFEAFGLVQAIFWLIVDYHNTVPVQV